MKILKIHVMGCRSVLAFSESFEEIENQYYKYDKLKPIKNFSLKVFEDIVTKESVDHSLIIFPNAELFEREVEIYSQELIKDLIKDFDSFIFRKTRTRSLDKKVKINYYYINFYNVEVMTGAELSLMALHPRENVRAFFNEVVRFKNQDPIHLLNASKDKTILQSKKEFK